MHNRLKNSFLVVLLTLCWGSSMTFAAPVNDTSEVLYQNIELSNAEIFERESIKHAKAGNTAEAVLNLQKYIFETGDFDILKNGNYQNIRKSEAFVALKEKYLVNFDMGTFFFLYVGLIGLFIALILNVRKKTDHTANALIGLFVFMHSFFLIHVSLYLTNYTFYVPHTLSMSTSLSFLYGPVLYFYFKRISDNYTFTRKDLLHLLPTVGIIILLMPIYVLSAEDKLQIMLGTTDYGEHPYLTPITFIKLISLIAYGYMTFRVYRRNVVKQADKPSKKIRLQKTIMIIHAVYALSYTLYAVVIIQNVFSGIMFNLQLFAMTALVLYIGYIAYANPKILVVQYRY